MTTPNPATLFGNRKAPVPPAPPTQVRRALVAKVEPVDPSKPGQIVRPGFADVIEHDVHDGVVKTKHLQVGQRVRPYLNGAARGGERVVAKVTRVPETDGALVEVEWSSGHPTSQHKAAYRWYDEDLEGTLVEKLVKKPALVSYEEV